MGVGAGRSRRQGTLRRPVRLAPPRNAASENAAQLKDQLKDEPHPQVRVAFGFEMWNPASLSPSL